MEFGLNRASDNHGRANHADGNGMTQQRLASRQNGGIGDTEGLNKSLQPAHQGSIHTISKLFRSEQ